MNQSNQHKAFIENRTRTRTFWQRSVVVVQQLLAVKWLQALQNTEPDTASTDCADDLVLQVVRVPRDLGDVPVPALDHLVCGHKVPDEEEDAHDDVLSDRHDVRARYLEHLDPVLDRSVEVDVVGPNAGGDAELQALGLLDQIAGEIAWVEGSGDEDLCLWKGRMSVNNTGKNPSIEMVDVHRRCASGRHCRDPPCHRRSGYE